ncbi:amidohydrolase [Dactylosporangium sp. NPDC050688]|uniref:amidohydrolase n=1 Tax=Dactylosporangium sp. NPDC050688 TaxID=3157217 RepID=UPI0033C40FF4
MSTNNAPERSPGSARTTPTARTAADLVLFGGTVLTHDPDRPRVGAVAVAGDSILDVGDDAAMLALAAPDAQLINLGGRAALPGFIETHTHPYFYGSKLDAAVDAATRPGERLGDLVERIREGVRHVPAGEWIVAQGYDDTLLAEGRHPTLADLDPVSPNHPVVLHHVSGHICVVNSVALRAAGFADASADPPGGLIGRDEHGRANGVLYEAAAFAVNRCVPPPDTESIQRRLRLAGEAFLAAGITCVHDAAIGGVGGTAELDQYRLAQDAGRLRTRVRGYLFHPRWSRLIPDRLTPDDFTGPNPDLLRVVGVKIVADGSIQARTARLTGGYHPVCAEDGVLLLPPRQLTETVRALSELGWQVAVHGNGDGAIDAILDAFEGPAGADNPLRHRIEHCQTVRDDQLDRIARHRILVSFFIKHVHYWGDRHRDLFLGPQRAARISPLAGADARGITFALHSDAPVTPPPPLEGIWCAATRRTSGGAVLGADQTVPVGRALRGYTSDAAYFSFDEDRLGRLRPGYLADIAVLSADPSAGDPMSVRDIGVDTTIVGGQVAYQRR